MGIGLSKRRSDWPHSHHPRYPYHPPPPPPPPPLPLPSPSPPPQLHFSSPHTLSSQPSPSNPPISSFLPPSPPPDPPLPGYAFTAGGFHPTVATCFPYRQPASYPAGLPYPAPLPNAYPCYPQSSTGGHGRPNYEYYAISQGGSWWPQPAPMPYPASFPSSCTVAQQPLPPYVEHKRAVTVKNNVNLHKDTIRLERDKRNPDHYLVFFTFDSLADGNVTVFYFGKEGKNCCFSPLYPDIYMPVRVPFKEGPGQKFCQPSGTGIDLGFFELDELSEPQGDAFPLVISAEASLEPSHMGEDFSPAVASCAQITQAVIERKCDGLFQVKVIKQILWVSGKRYELKEIFGLASSEKTDFGDNDLGKECVICMSEPKDTAVLPCRHMCMCSGCAKSLRLQSNKCPICRQPVEELMEIKVKCRSAV